MRILLTGKDGQVGWELQKTLAALGEVTAFGRSELDLRDTKRIGEMVRAAKPDVIVNAAAYTAVDKAESERDLAFAVNAVAPGVLAAEAKRCGALLVHYSTDYVFDGSKNSPYVENDEPNPLNVYGASKLAGERAIADSGCRHLILRTSWVYSHRGSNFMLAILRKARETGQLRVVADQIGAPTSAALLARATAAAIPRALSAPEVDRGLYHLAAAGKTSWHGFAQAIVAASGVVASVAPIASSEFQSAARRPRYSILDSAKFERTFVFKLPKWQDAVGEVVSRAPPL